MHTVCFLSSMFRLGFEPMTATNAMLYHLTLIITFSLYMMNTVNIQSFASYTANYKKNMYHVNPFLYFGFNNCRSNFIRLIVCKKHSSNITIILIMHTL